MRGVSTVDLACTINIFAEDCSALASMVPCTTETIYCLDMSCSRKQHLPRAITNAVDFLVSLFVTRSGVVPLTSCRNHCGNILGPVLIMKGSKQAVK